MKLPEPFLLFDVQRKTVHFPIPTKIDVPMTVVIEPMKLYTEAQLKQAVKDALEAAAKGCEELDARYGGGDMAIWCADEIRKLMEGI